MWQWTENKQENKTAARRGNTLFEKINLFDLIISYKESNFSLFYDFIRFKVSKLICFCLYAHLYEL